VMLVLLTPPPQVDIVCGTPGRLDDMISTGKLDLSNVRPIGNYVSGSLPTSFLENVKFQRKYPHQIFLFQKQALGYTKSNVFN